MENAASRSRSMARIAQASPLPRKSAPGSKDPDCQKGEVMENLIAAILLLAILGAAILHIRRAKKNGSACAGCPDSKHCTHCAHRHTDAQR